MVKRSGRKAHCVTTERYITVRSKILITWDHPTTCMPCHQLTKQCIYILAFVHMEWPNSIIDASLEQQFTLVVQGNHYEPKLKDVFYQWHTRLSKNTPWPWLSSAPLQSVGPFHWFFALSNMVVEHGSLKLSCWAWKYRLQSEHCEFYLLLLKSSYKRSLKASTKFPMCHPSYSYIM